MLIAIAELVVFALVTVPFIVTRATQRGVKPASYVGPAITGFVLIYLVGVVITPLLSAVARWVWVGGIILVLEFFSNRGRRGSGTWHCPECQMYNDSRTLKCLCGHVPSAE